MGVVVCIVPDRPDAVAAVQAYVQEWMEQREELRAREREATKSDAGEGETERARLVAAKQENVSEGAVVDDNAQQTEHDHVDTSRREHECASEIEAGDRLRLLPASQQLPKRKMCVCG